MNEATHKQLLEALRDTPCARAPAHEATTHIAVRVSPGGHFALGAVLTFVSMILLRTNRDLAALVLVTSTWIIVPILVATDRLYFNGRALFRSGLVPMLSRLALGRRQKLALADVERVEVATVRTLRRGGSVRYRYSIEISGKGRTFAFASGKNFRQMVRSLLPVIADAKLDARACELRDYLCEPKEIRRQVEALGIAAPSVSESANARRAQARIERHVGRPSGSHLRDEQDRSRALRQAANHLRVAGRLSEAAEAFRRALHLTPHNGFLLYEYARLLRSQASAFSDARLLTRACAALKLSLMRSGEDSQLAERIGESLFEFGQTRRAANALRHALEINPNSFRALLVLAEIALSEGKLAHVIHHYGDAARVAPDEAGARMARREADYYARLNDDDDYLSAELRRMNWLEGAGRVQQFSARISFAALFVALVGSFFDPIVASVGWSLASSSILGWSGALIMRKFLSRRRSVDVSA